MQKKIKPRYIGSIYQKEHSLKTLPNSKEIEDRGIGAIIFFKKNKNI